MKLALYIDRQVWSFEGGISKAQALRAVPGTHTHRLSSGGIRVRCLSKVARLFVVYLISFPPSVNCMKVL